jgi:hypothetical protein
MLPTVDVRVPNGPGAPPPLPGWLGSAVQVTTQVGIPTVFAIVLLWYVLFKFEGSMDKISERLERNADSVAEFSKIQAQQLAELQKQTAALQELARMSRYKEQPEP